MTAAEGLSDAELRDELKRLGAVEVGPINAATRGAYLKKLEKLLKERARNEEPIRSTTKRRASKSRRTAAERRSDFDRPDDVPSDERDEPGTGSALAPELDVHPKTYSKIPGAANISSPAQLPSRIELENPSPSAMRVSTSVDFQPNFRKRDLVPAASLDSDANAEPSDLRSATSRIDPGPGRREPPSRNRDWDASGAVGRLRDRLEDENSWLNKYTFDSSSRVRRRFEGGELFDQNSDQYEKSFPDRDPSGKYKKFNFRRPEIAPTETSSTISAGRFGSAIFARPARKVRGSTFRGLSRTLEKLRGFFYDTGFALRLWSASFRDKFFAAFQRQHSKTQLPSEKFYSDRFRSSNIGYNAENMGRVPSCKPQIYRKVPFLTLGHETSRHILLALIIFLLFLIIGYFLTVYLDHVRRTANFFYGAGVDTVTFVYRNMILPVLAIISAFGFAYGIFLYKRYKWHKVAEEQRQIFEMVEEIIATLKKHHEDCLANGNRQPYLAVPHVRDMLIPPHRRKELWPIWDKAVEYLNENESRVRTENQCISGEEFMVWRWLQIVSQQKQEEKIWQGHAFPEEEVECNAPKFAYFECLKLRGLFDPAVEDEEDWPEHIQDAILEKLGPAVQVLHLAVDLKSKDGCVYMKMANNAQAGEAYKTLNGSWFNGRLVSVKYLRPERYHERFPDARHAFVPLRVKKARNSLRVGFR